MTGYTPLTRETIDLQQNDDSAETMNLAPGLRAGTCLFVSLTAMYFDCS